MAKTFAGARLRRLREERGLTQVALARALGLSTSYVNQLENDQRPITVPVLLTLTERFDLPTQYFPPDSDARLVSDLSRGARRGGPRQRRRSRSSSPACPQIGQTLVNLHRRLHDATADLEALHSRGEPGDRGHVGAAQQPMPFEEVRDFFYDRKNYIGELDIAAEELFHREPAANRRTRRPARGAARRPARHHRGDRRRKCVGSQLQTPVHPESQTLVPAHGGCIPASAPFSSPPRSPCSPMPSLITGDRRRRRSAQRRCPRRRAHRPGQLFRRRAAVALPEVPRWPPRVSATTSTSWHGDSRSGSKPSATGSPRCNARTRAGCRSSSSAPTAPETSLNASPPRHFTSPASAETARYGWFITRFPDPASS